MIERGLAELDRAAGAGATGGAVPAPGRDRRAARVRGHCRRDRLGPIVGLYDALLEAPNPVVALNRPVAIGFRDGPDAGLAALDEVDLPGYHLVEATRAEFLRRAGRPREAAAAYRQALDLVGTDAERRLLERRLADVVRRLGVT